MWDTRPSPRTATGCSTGDVAAEFLATLLDQPEVWLLSSKHFSVDGSLIQAWASMKSFRPKDGDDVPPGSGRNGSLDFRGERRSNDSHASTIDSGALLYRKGTRHGGAVGHVLMENRSGL